MIEAEKIANLLNELIGGEYFTSIAKLLNFYCSGKALKDQ